MHNHGPCLGYQAITLSTTATSGLTIPGNPKYANAALVRVETANARFLMTGVTGVPTTGTTGGMPILTTDQPLWLEPSQGGLINFQAIAQTGNPILHVLYFGVGQR